MDLDSIKTGQTGILRSLPEIVNNGGDLASLEGTGNGVVNHGERLGGEALALDSDRRRRDGELAVGLVVLVRCATHVPLLLFT